MAGIIRRFRSEKGTTRILQRNKGWGYKSRRRFPAERQDELGRASLHRHRNRIFVFLWYASQSKELLLTEDIGGYGTIAIIHRQAHVGNVRNSGGGGNSGRCGHILVSTSRACSGRLPARAVGIRPSR